MIAPVKTRTMTLTDLTICELEKAIAEGTFPPGGQFPSENELIRLLGVSRTTVREALRRLEERGMIVRKQGVGTFLRNRGIVDQLNENFSVVELVRSANMDYGAKDVSVNKVPSNKKIAEKLQIESGEPVILVQRTRTANQRPAAFSLDYFPSWVVPDPDIFKDAVLNDTLYRVLKETLHISISYGIAHLFSENASLAISKTLELEQNCAIMKLEQVDYDARENPVLYTNDYYAPGIFDFVVFRKGGGVRG